MESEGERFGPFGGRLAGPVGFGTMKNHGTSCPHCCRYWRYVY